MSFPFDHHSHHHHHHKRRDVELEQEYRNYPPPPSNYPPPGAPYQPPPPNYSLPPFGDPYPPPPFTSPDQPPPPYGGSYPPPYGGSYPPPPAEVTKGGYHTSHNDPFGSYDYPPPPQPEVVTISEHYHGGGGGSHHFHLPEMGPHSGPQTRDPELGELASKPTYGIYSKAGGDRFAVAIRDSKVVLTYADVNDPTQHWIKDEKYSTKVKDKDGYPGFSLVNRSTKHALKHSVFGHPVHLTQHKLEFFDVSVLWTESHDLGDGYRTIRTVNNTKLVLDAFHGDKDHGGVHDGTIVALYECWKGDNQNQRWKLVRF